MNRFCHYTFLSLFLSLSIITGHAEEYIYHTIQIGESPYIIARKYKVTLQDIYQLNPGSEKKIWAGATLRLPANSHILPVDTTTIETDTLNIQAHVRGFLDEMANIDKAELNTLDDINLQQKKLDALNIKWNTYYQSKQVAIGNNDSLLNLVAEFQQYNKDISDSLNICKQRMQHSQQFSDAIAFIKSQLDSYKKMSRQAYEFSLTENTAPLLEKLKDKEQVLFSNIDAKYQIANGIAQQDPSLKKQMDDLTNVYLEIKQASDKIQQAEYQPFFARIKDYLLGLAAIAIILMFINMIYAKINTYKKLKEQQKKLKETFPNNEDHTTPTL